MHGQSILYFFDILLTPQLLHGIQGTEQQKNVNPNKDVLSYEQRNLVPGLDKSRQKHALIMRTRETTIFTPSEIYELQLGLICSKNQSKKKRRWFLALRPFKPSTLCTAILCTFAPRSNSQLRKSLPLTNSPPGAFCYWPRSHSCRPPEARKRRQSNFA